ncbi:MAG: hypothetical protein GY866_39880, partial [Proteobacteria bacterium]|nr:hypothetical protein [Pseudomonadota bacterium]
ESVENYDVVIIGSPIYYGKWLAEIPEFVENNLERLNEIPVACFITCMAAIKTDEDNIKLWLSLKLNHLRSDKLNHLLEMRFQFNPSVSLSI